MIVKYSVQAKNKEYFKKCIQLRKQGLSYSEIRKQIPLAKSTINNWLQYAGLTLTPEHLEIQTTKRIENHVLGSKASSIIRKNKREKEIANTVKRLRDHFHDTLFVTGIMLYQAEGHKYDTASFSNSDYKLIQIFLKFAEKYFSLKRMENMTFRVAVHETRKDDLIRILSFWAKKLQISMDNIRITWKRNVVTHRRNNKDYVGQMNVSLHGESYLCRKLLAISDIILTTQLKLDN